MLLLLLLLLLLMRTFLTVLRARMLRPASTSAAWHRYCRDTEHSRDLRME